MLRRFPTLRNSRREASIFRSRLLIIAIFIAGLAVVLMFRLGDLQLFQHKRYTTLARQNLVNLLPIEPNRGLIYDRHGVLLAENVPVFELVLVPDRVSDIPETIKSLQKIIFISDDDLR